MPLCVQLCDPAAMLNISFTNFAGLRLYEGAETTATVVAHTLFGDGGGGVFSIKVGDTSTPDDNGLVIVDALNRRWWRNYNSAEIDARWFNVKFDGVTDDTAALTAWFTAVMASSHREGTAPAGVALVTAALPTINVPGVAIRGVGPSGNHDVGSVTGTTIKYTGAPGATMLTIAPNTGASAQRLAGNAFKGITLDCNGLAAKGLILKSCAYGEFDFTVYNPTSIGFELNVVSTLGEAKDTFRNRIRYTARCVESVDGIGMVLGGDTVANTCFNNFEYIDINHTNGLAIRCDNSDNNNWFDTRAFCGGSAVNSVEFRGGATESVSSRGEVLYKLSVNRPVIARGTGTYAWGSHNHRIFSIDKENGSPDPTVEAGASLSWSDNGAANRPRRSYTPTLSADNPGTGSFVLISARYSVIEGVCEGDVTCHIPLKGTATGALKFTLPILPTYSASVAGFRTSDGHALIGNVVPSTLDVRMGTVTGGDPLGDGDYYNISFKYEVA